MRLNRALVVMILSALLVAGCATAVRPDALQIPSEMTCVYLKDAQSFTATYGAFNVHWTTRLAKGPYWSERADEKGTYFRAPPGGLTVTGTKGEAPPGWTMPLDGGFYIPNDPHEPVSIYRYFSTVAAPVDTAAQELTCAGVAYARGSAGTKVSLLTVAAAGAAGGAAGGVLGRGIANGGKLSYGQAAGAGAAGGLIGGLIIASIINADVGKILPSLSIRDAQFMEDLRRLAAARVPMKQAQLAATTESGGGR